MSDLLIKMRYNFPVFSFLSKRMGFIFILGRVGVGFLLLLMVSCAGVSKSELTRAKTIAISKEQFANNPFGFEPTLHNFENRYGKILKRQRYFLQSTTNPAYTDTIYRFYKGKTEVFFYKPMQLGAKIVGANIYKPEIELRNEIRVGISRKEFFWKFTDWLYDESDKLTIESPATDCVFTFIFSHDKLKAIKVTGKQIEKMPQHP